MPRRYPEHPLVGVGALIFTRAGRRGPILLVERAGEPLKGYWSLPGGLVETGERLEEAVRREILEETGLASNPCGVSISSSASCAIRKAKPNIITCWWTTFVKWWEASCVRATM